MTCLQRRCYCTWGLGCLCDAAIGSSRSPPGAGWQGWRQCLKRHGLRASSSFSETARSSIQGVTGGMHHDYQLCMYRLCIPGPMLGASSSNSQSRLRRAQDETAAGLPADHAPMMRCNATFRAGPDRPRSGRGWAWAGRAASRRANGWQRAAVLRDAATTRQGSGGDSVCTPTAAAREPLTDLSALDASLCRAMGKPGWVFPLVVRLQSLSSRCCCGATSRRAANAESSADYSALDIYRPNPAI